MNHLDQTAGVITQGNNKRLLLVSNLYVLMFAYAISATIIGPLIPTYMQQFGISLSQSGLITSIQGFGGLLAIVAGIFIVEKIRKSLMVKLTFLIYCISVIMVAVYQSYAWILLFFFLIGASTKLLDGSLNAYTADLYPEKRQRCINLLHAFFGAGALVGPIISSSFLQIGLGINTIFISLGIFCCMCFLSYFFVQLKGVKVNQRQTTTTKHFAVSFFRKKDIIVFAVLSLLYTGFSSGVSTWIPTLMTVEYSSPIQMSSLPVSFLWVGIIISRLVYSSISEKVNIKRILIYSNLICALFWFSAILMNSSIMVGIACGVSGLCTGAIIPLSVALACNRYPNNSGTVSFIIFLYVTIGYMLIPWIFGVLGDAVNIWFSILVMGAMLLAISILSIFISSDKTVKIKKSV